MHRSTYLALALAPLLLSHRACCADLLEGSPRLFTTKRAASDYSQRVRNKLGEFSMINKGAACLSVNQLRDALESKLSELTTSGEHLNFRVRPSATSFCPEHSRSPQLDSIAAGRLLEGTCSLRSPQDQQPPQTMLSRVAKCEHVNHYSEGRT